MPPRRRGAGREDRLRDPRATGDEEDPHLDSMVQEFRIDLRQVRRSFNRMALVEWMSFRTRAIDAAFSAALVIGLFGFCLAAFVLAAAFLANGVRQALGDLGAGLAIAGLVVIGAAAARWYVRRRGVRAARREMEREDLE